ncbi:ferritin-like fold-containing protein [uncultured Mobiluncus sp.]|uniref:ferritin-like fold-containing protein n=1 Tax=uncultured Mobiluncus sp. TaxID=293425 RepID=UPI00261F59EB|nr:ferritin-like fold-containing protein [uncultured Mobiluncus sp.]
MEISEERTAHMLGLVAFTRITAYARLARDVSQTTDFADQLALARMGVSFVTAIDDLEAFANRRGLDLADLTQPYVGFFDDMELRTRPRDWWERMVKSYIFVGILADMEDLAAQFVGADMIEILGVSGSAGLTQWVRARLRDGIAADPTVESRLSMWGRRVAGEAVAGVRAILDTYPLLLPEGVEASDKVEEIQKQHSRRMEDLGLAF